MIKFFKNLQATCLDDLNEEWVNAVFESDYKSYEELPEEYNNNTFHKVFRNTIRVLTDWLNSDEEDETKRWKYLSQQFNYRALIALIGYYINLGNTNISCKDHRNMSLLACRMYFKLLLIPGCKAYLVYHSLLFNTSLGCLSYPKGAIDNENTSFNTMELVRDVNSILDQLWDLVIDLRQIITKLELRSGEMNFEDILKSLVEVAGGVIVSKLNIDKVKMDKVLEVIYDVIHLLICECSDHPSPDAIQLIFKAMLPKLIATSVDCKQYNMTTRESYVSYCCSLLERYGSAAIPGYLILIQHVCYTTDGLERVEVRNGRMSLVVCLLAFLPQKPFMDIVKWVIKLSTTARVSHRQIALELLAKLLSMDVHPQYYTGSGIQAAEDDRADVELEERPPEETPVENQTQDVPTENTTTDDNAADERNITPVPEPPVAEENAPEPASASAVSRGELLRAVYERHADASGTLRARALAILTECLDSPLPPVREALKELEGGGAVSRLVATASRCACDERAAVRRAAAALLRRMLASPAAGSPAPVTPLRDYASLVGLCRDASIIVRVAAIGALGELLLCEPTDPLVDAFLSGPMHQLSDPEAKIQEQVTVLVQRILLDRLKSYSPDSAVDPLPWMFLAGVVRNNMRRHLQKACTMLANTSTANNIIQSLVGVASSHLGVPGSGRDLQCLVLLTSLARHVPCHDVGFALRYYYSLEDDPEERDGRAAALVLELLGTWASGASREEARHLRERLLQRLASAPTDGCRPACAYLAVQLDPDNVQWASELMQISERRALGGGGLEEWVRAADLSLVARVPPDPALLRLFLQALTNPPPEWCERRRATCVAGAARLCVRSRAAAVALAPPLAALLQHPAVPLAPRHNALLALADIATRYSCIVEPQLGVICGCLDERAPAALRRAAARALTRLLLAGFLRLRIPLYYRFCALLADADDDVREPAEYYVTSCLMPDDIYQHFVDCIIHYNKEDTEVRLSYEARQLIYDVMLQRLSMVQRFNVQCRLARELLARAAEAECAPPPHTTAALMDAIALLCGPRMRLPKQADKDNDAAEVDQIRGMQERVTTNIVSHKMKRAVAEVLVPAVLRLYASVRHQESELATSLVRIATDLLNDYRQEIEELFDNDEDLLERVNNFQETVGQEPWYGNARNLYTDSAPPEAETPHVRKRCYRPTRTVATPRRRRLL